MAPIFCFSSCQDRSHVVILHPFSCHHTMPVSIFNLLLPPKDGLECAVGGNERCYVLMLWLLVSMGILHTLVVHNCSPSFQSKPPNSSTTASKIPHSQPSLRLNSDKLPLDSFGRSHRQRLGCLAPHNLKHIFIVRRRQRLAPSRHDEMAQRPGVRS